MTNLGIDVMLNMLSGNKETVHIVNNSLGKTIDSVKVGPDENELQFHFDDRSAIKLFDDGQSCCEHRYMHTDDDLSWFSGSILENIELSDGPEQSLEYGDFQESQFLIITTNKGQFTIVNYNEHNGYYSGFSIAAKEL